MATVELVCQVLNGDTLEVEVDPAEPLSCLQQRLLERLGGNEFQVIKIFDGENELCYDASFAESGLTPGSIVQVFVAPNFRKAKDVINWIPIAKKAAPPRLLQQWIPIAKKAPPPLLQQLIPIAKKAPPPPTPAPVALLRPYTPFSSAARGEARESINVHDYVYAANVILDSNGDDEDTRKGIDDFHVHMSYLARDVDIEFSLRMAALAYCCSVDFCSAHGGVGHLRETLQGALVDRNDKYSIRGDEHNLIWFKLIDALAPYEHAYNEGILCSLVSVHEHAEVRAAAVRALGFGQAWAAKYIQALKEVAAADPADIVRQAAAASLQALEAAQSKNKLPPSPPAPRLALPALRGPPPKAAPVNGGVRGPSPKAALVNRGERRAPSIEESERSLESLQHEQQELQEALLRSKADAWNADGVVLCRLTSHTGIMSYLLESDELAGICSRVWNADCSVRPDWAKGALLLVPVTEQQIKEADIDLKAHNILMLSSDMQLVKDVLSRIPKRKRPELKPEFYPHGKPENARSSNSSFEPEGDQAAKPHFPNKANGDLPAQTVDALGYGQGSSTMGWSEDVELVVERTFLNFRIEKDVSDASTIIHSAPAHCDASLDQLNPHQWRLPRPRDER
eukprot:TRINITY_DN4062_c0_g1_i1.p1 TRINITY_DN4062_c0_g1~~TRINITY_DN4062_c0_g1_i1.p1  ORF type:complete len:646 (-),score=80.83 TRINITY_DN4062_c0_g1_i1:250-2124(-)